MKVAQASSREGDGAIVHGHCESGFERVRGALSEILASGWPEAESFVAENIRTVPSRAEATAFFESKA